jgi:transglutaminase-like putative cysteine protease
VIAVRRPAGAQRIRSAPSVARTVSAWTSVAAVATAAVFVALPRLPGSTIQVPPFSVEDAVPVEGFDGRVANPGLEVGPDGVARFSELAYPGFGSSVDLRSRGMLSDEVMMRVRSPQAALWRGQAYDTYDGSRWTASDDTTVALGRAFSEAFDVPPPVEGAAAEERRVTTTFFVERSLPNIVFGAYRADEVYFPTGSVSVDRYGSIRSPIALEPGLVYSVISTIPTGAPAALPADGIEWDPEVLDRYTRLPADLPPRVAALAREIAIPEPTVLGRVEAVERWLREHTRYDLGIPADPPGVDAVDHFLFERRRGYCEHIASAMVVLLRSMGAPSRLVTGFGPGRRNPFTGYWEVRASDAHAWVEVLHPDVGWIAYDPTFGVPPAEPGAGTRFIAPQVLRAVGTFLGSLVPEPVREGAKALGRGAVAAARWLAEAWPVAIVGAVALGLVVLAVRRRRIRRRAVPPPAGTAKAFAELEAAMAARGHPRRPHETPAEFLRTVSPVLDADRRAAAGVVVRAFEREVFAGDQLADEDVYAALVAAASVRGPSA